MTELSVDFRVKALGDAAEGVVATSSKSSCVDVGWEEKNLYLTLDMSPNKKTTVEKVELYEGGELLYTRNISPVTITRQDTLQVNWRFEFQRSEEFVYLSSHDSKDLVESDRFTKVMLAVFSDQNGGRMK